MQINRKLNIVLPLERENGTIYIHAMPIGEAIFKRYFIPISKTFAAIYADGASMYVGAGPRIAALYLEKIAEDMGIGPDVRDGLLAEIRRLASAIVLTEKGWEPMPLDEALRKNLLDSDEKGEVENALAFFTVASVMHLKRQLPGVLGIVSDLWGARPTSLTCTEYATSLPTSTPGAVTASKATA